MTLLRIEPSRPPGDAPCPACGSLLWFNGTEFVQRETQTAYCVSRVIKVSQIGGDGTRLEPEPPIQVHDRVCVTQGMFADLEGSVVSVDQNTGRLTLEIVLYGRPTPVEVARSHVDLIAR